MGIFLGSFKKSLKSEREPEWEAAVPCVAFLPWLWAASSGPSVVFIDKFLQESPTALPPSDVATVDFDGGDFEIRHWEVQVFVNVLIVLCGLPVRWALDQNTHTSLHGWTYGAHAMSSAKLLPCVFAAPDDTLFPSCPNDLPCSQLGLACFSSKFNSFLISNPDPESAQVTELGLSWFKETTSHT